MKTLDYQQHDEGSGTSGGGGTAKIILASLNVLSCIAAGVLILPLAIHIFQCTTSPKWCHLAAAVYGMPGLLVVVVLSTLSTTWAFGGRRRTRNEVLLVLLPVAATAAMLLLLAVAVFLDL